MYRNRLDEIRREKGLSNKQWSIESGVSLDTITRIIHPDNPEKDSAKVNTLEDLCKPLNKELWEIFYIGDTSFVAMHSELTALRAERDALIAEIAVLRNDVATLRTKNEELKDELISLQRFVLGNIKNLDKK